MRLNTADLRSPLVDRGSMPKTPNGSLLTLQDDITVTVGGCNFQLGKQNVIDREPHSIISHAIEGPWADKDGLNFPDMDGDVFNPLVHYIAHGFLPRTVDFALLTKVFQLAEYFQFTRLLPISLTNPRQDALEEADVRFILAHHPPPTNLSRAVLAHHSYKNVSFRQGANLSHAFLLGCQLHECDFSQSDLSGTAFHSCWCEATVFRNSNTAPLGVSFTSCRLAKADLSGLDLRNACFRDVSLNGAIMCGVNLAGANLRGFELSDVNFAGADLTGADLRNTTLDNVIFNSANCKNCNFENARGSTVDFACADISGASFVGASLPHANFSAWVPSFVSTGDGAISIVINFNESIKAVGTNFQNCSLVSAIFSLDISAAREYWERHATRYISPTLPRFDLLAAGARVKRSMLDKSPSSGNLSDLKHRKYVLDLNSEAAKAKYAGQWMTGLDSLQMAGAVLCGSFLRKVDLHGANLENADLRRADLCSANLSRTNLRGAQMQAQVLSSTDLRHADLEGANLTNALLLKARLEGAKLQRAFAVRATIDEQQRQKLVDAGAQTSSLEQDERFIQTPSVPANEAGSANSEICFTNATLTRGNSWFNDGCNQ